MQSQQFEQIYTDLTNSKVELRNKLDDVSRKQNKLIVNFLKSPDFIHNLKWESVGFKHYFEYDWIFLRSSINNFFVKNNIDYISISLEKGIILGVDYEFRAFLRIDSSSFKDEILNKYNISVKQILSLMTSEKQRQVLIDSLKQINI